MKKITAAVITTFMLSMPAVTLAAGNHKDHAHDAKAMHGGLVTVVNEINYELVAKDDTITLYVTDHGKPVDTKEAAASLTLLSASGKTEVKLAPAGKNKLEAKGAFKVQPGTKVAGPVTLGGKTQIVKFSVK